MGAVAYVVAYIAVVVFLIAVAARILMWIRLPLHVRWELYPVAHEGKRASYGGSYLEETDWWKKPRESSLVGELKVMLPEILLLVALKEHNPRMWRSSFPFHLGVYLVSGATFLMIGRSLLGIVLPGIIGGGFWSFLGVLCLVCGVLGLCLGILGALGLLRRRLTHPDLKDFTAPADVFNLVLFVVVFAVALGHLVAVDRDLSRSMRFVDNLVRFDVAGTEPVLGFTALAVVLLGALLAYIPTTHMSHFIGKYFAYHAIRWNDDPNLRGGRYEARIQRVLSYPVSWSAAHIKGDGKKTWAEVATEEQEQEQKK